MFVNKYLKFVAIKKFNEDLLNKIIEIIEENKRKNIVIEIHDNIESDKDALTLKTLNKKLKPKKIKITIVYSKDYMEKNYSKQVILTTLEICALVIFVIIGVVSAFLVYNYYESDRKVGGIQNDLKEIMEEDNDKDKPIYNSVGIPIINNYDKLLEVNSDTVGWLKVKNTNIDYPVLKTTDNDYYLNRNFYKEKDPNGWVFMDYRNSIDELGRHTIIYAHNRYYSGVMFGSLNNVTKWKWYSVKDNWDITFNTLYENHTWRIFSIYSIDVTSDYLYTTFESDESYQAFIDLIKNRTDIKFTTEVDKDDKILTLSTCLNGDRRLVVHAVLVEE
jgi:sortase B